MASRSTSDNAKSWGILKSASDLNTIYVVYNRNEDLYINKIVYSDDGQYN